MQYYFAPLEGLTDRVYRQLHHKYFPGIDRYYMPFLSPTVHRALTPKEAKELPPANSRGFTEIPQLLTKVPEDFLWMAQQCRDLGYEEVNLNIGCPSGTVTAKGKGAGMLRDLDALDRFLDTVFYYAPLPISVKTRIGFYSPEEWQAILTVLTRYPIAELTVHPRIRDAFYKGSVDMDAFRYCAENTQLPLCYNGDLTTLAQVKQLTANYRQINAVMLGRGLIADPGMLTPGGTELATLARFMQELLETYTEVFGGTRNAMFRLKEHWHFLLTRFENTEKLEKRLRKTTDLGEFKDITAQILHTLPRKQ